MAWQLAAWSPEQRQPSNDEGRWLLRYRDTAGKLHRYRRTTEQIMRHLRAGRLPRSMEARPDKPNAAFLPLAMHAGLTCAITNPLEGQVRRAILAGDLLLAHDEYAMRWIASFRAEQASKAAR